MKRRLHLISIALLLGLKSYSQIGIGVSTPHNSSILEINASDKGVLIPRVNLIALNDSSTIDNPASGLMIYNIGSSIAKGFYFWEENKWNKILNTAVQKFELDSNLVGSGLELKDGKIQTTKALPPLIRNQKHSNNLNELDSIDRRFKIFNPLTEKNSVYSVILYGTNDICGLSVVIDLTISTFYYPQGNEVFPVVNFNNGFHNYPNIVAYSPNGSGVEEGLDGAYISDPNIGFMKVSRININDNGNTIDALAKYSEEISINMNIGGTCYLPDNTTLSYDANISDFHLKINKSTGYLDFLNVNDSAIILWEAKIDRLF